MSRHLCTQSGPLAVGFSYEADLMSSYHCLICAWSSDVSEPYAVRNELAESEKCRKWAHRAIMSQRKTTVSVEKHLTLCKRAVKPGMAFETADKHKLHLHKRIHQSP
jgi:hypothetical protein